MNSAFRSRLLEQMQSLATVDCHSHTSSKQAYYDAGGKTLFNLMSYFERDIASVTGAGSSELYAGCTSDADRWQRLKGVLDRTGNVSYWRHNLVMYRELFGLADDELTDDNWSAVSDAIKAKTADPGWYDHVTRDVCRVRTQVKNIPWFEDWDPAYFTAVLRMEPALQLHDAAIRASLEQRLGRSIGSLAEAREALAALVADYQSRGAIGIKLAHAYGRTLASQPVPQAEAGPLFDRALRGEALTAAEVLALQDHIIYYLADLAGERGLVFQIHTGVQGNWCNVPDSNPLHLSPLILSHRNVRFDLFHAGYPFSREIGMMGKHYPNVWLNMAWMYVVTMAGSRQTLSEWLDLVPAERILGFGSDVFHPEFIYAHLVMARSCLADVLAEKVERDFLSESAALSLVPKLLHDNAVKLYDLD
jgi:uncharacterized protein